MGKMVEIDEDELNATRQQASQALPWQEEATRLAEALYNVRPNHPLLRNEIWREMIEERERREREGTGISPDHAAMSRISEFDHAETINSRLTPLGEEG